MLMEVVNSDKMLQSMLPQWRCPQNLFRYHHVSPGSRLPLLMMTGMSKLTLHPEGLRSDKARQGDSITAMTTMEEQIMFKRLQAWKWML